MKDLYRALGVEPTASTREIRSQLHASRGQLSAEVAADIEHVLLDELRRKKYDNVHKTVQCIVDLRKQISIQESSGYSKSSLKGFLPRVRHHQRASSQAAGPQAGTSGRGCLVFVLLVAGLVIGIALLAEREKKSRMPANNSTRSPAQLEGSTTEWGRLPMPPTGLVRRYDLNPEVAPLEIRTWGNDGNYFIKIYRIAGNQLVLSRTAFIRTGDRLEIDIPLGSYEIRYAVGTDWYGTERHFGRLTSYAKADDAFTSQETLRGYSGYTVELFMQRNGNLEIEPLSVGEF